MNSIGQSERMTQNRVIKLFQDKLHYRYLGNWYDRENNSNIEAALLTAFLRKKYSDNLITKALHKLNQAASGTSLYEANKAVYSLLRYGVKYDRWFFEFELHESGFVKETVDRLTERGFTYEKDGLKVTSFPNDHTINENRPAYSYLLEAEGKKLFISGDLNRDKIDYPAPADEEPSDAMIVECAHFPAEKLLEKLKGCKAGKIIIVHVHPVSKYDIFTAAQKTFGRPMFLPNDGDSV